MRKSKVVTLVTLAAVAVAVMTNEPMAWSAEKRRKTSAPTGGAVSLPSPVKMLWIDNEADPAKLASREAIAAVLDKTKGAGFNAVVPDVKTFHGFGMYRSAHLPPPSSPAVKSYPADFDWLKVFCEEARKRGLKIHAGLNQTAYGAKGPRGRFGPAYDKPEWQSVYAENLTQLLSDDGTTAVAAVNDRAAAGVSVFTPRYGARLVGARQVGAVNDGISGKTGNRWVSLATSDTPSLTFRWAKPQEIAQARLTFPRGYPARTLTVNVGGEKRMVERNTEIKIAVSLAGTTAAQELRLDFNDPGADGMARVEEAELVTAAGRNVAPDAAVVASSTHQPGERVVVVVSDGKVTTLTRESAITTAGIEIPAGGFVALAEDTTTSQWMSNLRVGASLRVDSQTTLVASADWPSGPLVYLNPAHPDVQKHNADVIEELLANYDLDGIVLDRGRYDGAKSDFSEISRKRFEKDMGVKVVRWPEDVLTPANPLTGAALTTGPLHTQWMLWRPRVIRDYVAAMGRVVRKHPGKAFGSYVGGWYATYADVGVNWGIETYVPKEDYPWAPAGYEKGGYAGLVDYLMPGVYYSTVQAEGAADFESTVEGGLAVAARVTGGAKRLVPGIYVPNLNSDADYEAALRMCIEQTGGVMVFSQTTLDSLSRWDATRRGLEAVPQLLER